VINHGSISFRIKMLAKSTLVTKQTALSSYLNPFRTGVYKDIVFSETSFVVNSP